MPVEIEIRLNNEKGVEDAIVALQNEFGPKNGLRPLVSVIRKILKQDLPTLIEMTPYDLGHLAYSSRVRVVRLRKNQSAVWGMLGWGSPRRNQYLRGQQQLALEFGNRLAEAQPTLIPLFEQVCARWERDFGAMVGAEIELAAQRLARSQARGKLRVI